jgi:hypothetical protein
VGSGRQRSGRPASSGRARAECVSSSRDVEARSRASRSWRSAICSRNSSCRSRGYRLRSGGRSRQRCCWKLSENPRIRARRGWPCWRVCGCWPRMRHSCSRSTTFSGSTSPQRGRSSSPWRGSGRCPFWCSRRYGPRPTGRRWRSMRRSAKTGCAASRSRRSPSAPSTNCCARDSTSRCPGRVS